MTETEVPDDAVDANPQQPTPELTLQDLILVAQIIQLSSQRGTFKAEELENVGALYNKLIVFLTHAGAISTPEKKDD